MRMGILDSLSQPQKRPELQPLDTAPVGTGGKQVGTLGGESPDQWTAGVELSDAQVEEGTWQEKEKRYGKAIMLVLEGLREELNDAIRNGKVIGRPLSKEDDRHRALRLLSNCISNSSTLTFGDAQALRLQIISLNAETGSFTLIPKRRKELLEARRIILEMAKELP
jgi:hypothetical protein